VSLVVQEVDFSMRIAYLDCFSGISGDMFLGALLDAGVPTRVFEDAVAALNIGARLEIKRATRQGIAATKVDVFVGDEKELPREVYWEQQRHEHEHERHEHDHGTEHSHTARDVRASRPHPHQPNHERELSEIREIIQRAGIGETAKKTAIAIFKNLAAAEAKIHDTSVQKIHFHEVGAVDAMVDIVCAAVGAEALGVDEWVCSPLNVGSGTVRCAHGTLPVPAPATLELLKDAPVYSSGPLVELVTPTGAAIVKTLVNRFGSIPQMRVQTSAYGAGTRDFQDQANVLRITLGETRAADEKHAQQTIMVLEANLDDLSPQVFGYVMDRLLKEGALDAFGTAVQMKKSRPGMLLTVLARPEDAERMEKIVLAETTTLGVRRREEQRRVLERRFETVTTQWGDVRMKVANLNGTVSHYAPEYEDCRRIATEKQVPLKRVMQEAVRVYLGKSE